MDNSDYILYNPDNGVCFQYSETLEGNRSDLLKLTLDELKLITSKEKSYADILAMRGVENEQREVLEKQRDRKAEMERVRAARAAAIQAREQRELALKKYERKAWEKKEEAKRLKEAELSGAPLAPSESALPPSKYEHDFRPLAGHKIFEADIVEVDDCDLWRFAFEVWGVEMKKPKGNASDEETNNYYMWLRDKVRSYARRMNRKMNDEERKKLNG